MFSCSLTSRIHSAEPQVVRSSKRIISAANNFGLRGGSTDEQPVCQHASEGPPLKSFLFDIDGADKFAEYAKQTTRALLHVTETFPGLSLHDRLAIIVPDADFLAGLKSTTEDGTHEGPLVSQLDQAYAGRFVLVSAESATAACAVSDGQQLDREWLVLDTMENMDGLERLIVICVGLDSPIPDAAVDSSGDELGTRSVLYRALTRAHMQVLVVNEFLPNGWMAFLRNLQLTTSHRFDETAAQRDMKAAQEQIAARRQVEDACLADAKAAVESMVQARAAGPTLAPEAVEWIVHHVKSTLLNRGRRYDGEQLIRQMTLDATRAWEAMEEEARLHAERQATIGEALSMAMKHSGSVEHAGLSDADRSLLMECIDAEFAGGNVQLADAIREAEAQLAKLVERKQAQEDDRKEDEMNDAILTEALSNLEAIPSLGSGHSIHVPALPLLSERHRSNRRALIGSSKSSLAWAYAPRADGTKETRQFADILRLVIQVKVKELNQTWHAVWFALSEEQPPIDESFAARAYSMMVQKDVGPPVLGDSVLAVRKALIPAAIDAACPELNAQGWTQVHLDQPWFHLSID